jgi:hypothetical protein
VGEGVGRRHDRIADDWVYDRRWPDQLNRVRQLFGILVLYVVVIGLGVVVIFASKAPAWLKFSSSALISVWFWTYAIWRVFRSHRKET